MGLNVATVLGAIPANEVYFNVVVVLYHILAAPITKFAIFFRAGTCRPICLRSLSFRKKFFKVFLDNRGLKYALLTQPRSQALPSFFLKKREEPGNEVAFDLHFSQYF
jgi:hypothetical protein